jgi:catechol 2,3-dioxygenase-like lactoylglutathione lyase family enzyme
MLNQFPIHPTISVTDLEKAKSFYGETLGLKSKGEIADGHIQYEAGNGTVLLVFKRKNPPKAENTVASFWVDDVESVVKELRERGVKFEELDSPELKTVDGVATMGEVKAAWFKDPEGNILAVSSG